MTIRLMTLGDLPLGMALKSQAGWNQIEADWRRMIELEPRGCFVAERESKSDGRGIGTVVTCRFGPVAWIAMMLVEQGHRGRGVGRALMSRALEHLDSAEVASVRLDATPLGRPLYESMGFVEDATFLRYAGRPPLRSQPVEKVFVEQGLAGDGVAGCDQSATGTSRARLLTRLAAENPDELRVVRDGDRVAGYVLARPGANAWQIGPCVADGAEGAGLLDDALWRHRGEAVIVDIPANHAPARAIAEAHALTVARELTRMTRGARVPEDVRKIWASSGPELG